MVHKTGQDTKNQTSVTEAFIVVEEEHRSLY